MNKVYTLMLLSLISSISSATDRDGKGGGMTTDEPNMQVRVHYSTNMFVSVTNFGLIGSQDGEWIDPETGWPAPGVELPGSSGLDYLFMGALWIGAEVDTIDQNGNPALDTLVSVGNDGWWGGIFELLPPPQGEESLWEQQVIGDEEYFAVYYDTLTDPSYVNPDPNDQRVHLPLGLKITQNSAGWSSDGFNEFLIINYIIENIGDRYLHNAWLGIYCDGDVMHEAEQSDGYEREARDDISGYIQHGNYGIAWIADNDGEPHNGSFDQLSPSGIIGLITLGLSEPVYQTNFNWWASDSYVFYDWGPQWQSNFDIWGYFPHGVLGTPGGDKAKYYVMSNGERDYDQIWTDLDHTGEGWIREPDFPGDMANGKDTRFLVSYGPMEINPGAIETLTVALIGGNNLHTDPTNYDQHLRDRTYDSLSVTEYYNNLDFSDFLAGADSAISFYQRGYTGIPPGPPTALRVTDWSESHISLAWEPIFPPNLSEYRVYRGTEPGIYDPDKISPDGFIDSAFVDTDVENNITYFYAISSVNTLGIEGCKSYETSKNTSEPQRPTGLTSEAGNAEIMLSWVANPDSDLVGYIVYRALAHLDFVVVDTAETTSYTDVGLINGQEYWHEIRALDIYGNISAYSDTVEAIPMGFDSGILLLNLTRRSGNPDYDSMNVFYQNILQGYQYDITNYLPDNLQEIASYSTIMVCKELLGFNGVLYDGPLCDILSSYLNLGGNLIAAGTRQLTLFWNFEGTEYFNNYLFPNRCLNIGGVYFPDIYNTEFVGGESLSELFPDFSVDTVRANRIIYPPMENYGRLFGIGTLIPNDSSEVIYSYVAVEPDTSNFHGLPIGVIHRTNTYNAAVLEFPLYYVQEPTSFDILHTILTEFGEVPTSVDDRESTLPTKTALLQNYPNPFNPRTVIEYQLKKSGYVKLSIYNILGQQVSILSAGEQKPGKYTITWDASELPSGIYFARLETAGQSEIVKMTLLK